jgi:predicted RecB family nuclease
MLLTDELLLNYKRCQRRTFLDIYGNVDYRQVEKEFLAKLRRENRTHVQKILTDLNLDYQQVRAEEQNWEARAEETEILMQQGVEYIYEGVLTANLFDRQFLEDRAIALNSVTPIGNPHLLIKQPGKSKFGNWSYFPLTIRLGRRPKTEYKIIAAFHAYLLSYIQQSIPATAQIILRNSQNYRVNLAQWLPKTQQVIADCLKSLTEIEAPEVFISRQRCNLCHWYAHCYDRAKAQQHLSLVPGISPNRYEYLQAKGIDSLASLATASVLDLGEAIGFDLASQITQQAQSLIQDRALLKWNYDPTIESIPDNTTFELYFDIEAEPERNLDYLLGVLLVDRQNKTEQFYYFIAEKPEDEGKIWNEFLEFVSLYDRAPIFHFSEYEIDTIQRLTGLYGTSWTLTSSILSRCVDLHSLVTNSVALPVESYSLKSLANWLGFQWRDRTASGEQSVCWYDFWLQTGDRSWLDSILCYNEDDCRATFRLKEWLTQFLTNCSFDLSTRGDWTVSSKSAKRLPHSTKEDWV